MFLQILVKLLSGEIMGSVNRIAVFAVVPTMLEISFENFAPLLQNLTTALLTTVAAMTVNLTQTKKTDC